MQNRANRAGLAMLALAALCGSRAANAADAAPDPYHELETKYIFGFTEGADIGAEGEQAIELETTTQGGRRGGVYGTLEQEIEYESVPTQNFGYELSAHSFVYNVQGVSGAQNATGGAPSGLSAEFEYLVIGRGPGSPIGLTLVAAPEWTRYDDFGQHITDFANTLRAIADTELIANRLYGALNLNYTPDLARSPGQAWAQGSTLGASAAFAYRVSPRLTLGGEAEIDAAYDGLLARSWQGDAVFLGPTLHIQFTGKVMLAAAWETQVAGRAAGDSRGLDLADFPHQRANLKFEVEF